jgi:CheY-like chemotaxis protein
MTIPTDNQKIVISDLLKSADRAIKEGKLDSALDFVAKVFEIDERNVYARAYQERIVYLKESQTQVQEAEKKKDAETHAAMAKATEKRKTEEAKKSAPPPVEEAPIVERIREFSRPIKRSAATVDAYKTLLSEIWEDGDITKSEQTRIDSMMETFAISKEEHTELEREVRISAYINAVREAWQSGITVFDDIRKRFKISEQEHLSIEPTIMQMLQSLKSKGVVMVLDDDLSFLNLVREVLVDAGYYCYTSMSGEEGMKLLETTSPDLVVCDINFVKPHMSGFAFYEKFRSIEQFMSVPFIFLSALDQDIVVRTGKQMGADDYLTKPFDSELLLATIEGKLKRSRELRRKSPVRS